MKIKGFLALESIVAIIIAFLAASSFYLIVAEGKNNSRQIELKADQAYAYHVLKKNNLDKIMVHGHTYERSEN